MRSLTTAVLLVLMCGVAEAQNPKRGLIDEHPSHPSGVLMPPPPGAICNNTPATIPDNNPLGVTSVITIPCPNSTIADLDVLFHVQHTWVGNLRFQLTHVDTATTAMLINRPGVPPPNSVGLGCSGNDIDAILSDEATQPVENTCTPVAPTIAGTFIAGDPPNPALLASFDGQNLCGTWNLRVSDHASGDVGSVGQWCLIPTGFPPAGTDLSPTTGIFHVDATGMGPIHTSVAGQTLLQWQNPQTDPGTGQRTVQTELLSMDLTGSSSSLGSLNVRAGSQNGLPQTLGSVTPLGPGADFPALATFDVFFEVEVAGVATLRNESPLVMQADITEIPPRNIGLRNAGSILITDIADPTHVDVLQTALHWMCPPPFPPPGVPCPVPCGQSPFPVCGPASCPAGLQCAPTSLEVCQCVPGFPAAGTDLSPTVGSLRVDVIGVGPVDLSVSGQTLLQWQNPQTDPGTGERSVQTEMLSLDLAGSHPSIGNLNVTAGTQQGLPPTLGNVVPLGPGSDFPALATFDVFFDVEVQGVATLRNDQPLVMQAEITEIPPRAVGLRNAAPVQITDIANPQHIDTIQIAQHWMCPPPFPPPGVPCPVPCDQSPFPVCGPGSCPTASQQCVPSPATGQCVCVGEFPPPGTDLSPTVGAIRVDVIGVGPVDVGVAGQTLLQFSGPITNPATGERTVQTEMLSLDLVGSHPSIGNLNVTAGTQQGLPPTLGNVVPLGPGSDFPALATFDVFFDVEVQGVATLRNDQPLVMQAEITEIPPRAVGLRNAAPVQITDIANPQHIDTIQIAQHWMCPPPFPPTGGPCPVPCDRNPFPVCSLGACPPDLPLCVPDAALGACRCVRPFPPAGFDLSPTTGLVLVDVFGVGPTDVAVAGETLLQWQEPQTDPGTGQRTVQTEMLSLSLAGSNPSIGNLNVTAGTNHGLPPTLGSVTPLGDADFPALATFDVFFDVEVQGVATLRNSQPLVMQAEIVEIPPRNLGLQNLGPVQITDIADPLHIDTIQTAVHWMCPPPFPPPGVPCPVPCERSPFPLCSPANCPPGLQCVPTPIGCQCLPGFPPAGTDLSPTTGIFHVDATGVGPVDTSVAGQTLLQWQDPQTDPGTGQRTVQTELLSMDLSGSNPSLGNLNVRAGSQNGLPQTLGSVTPLGPGGDFPALATFDVFFEVEVSGVATLRNDEPLVMQAEITEIPPRNIGLRNTGPILITDIVDPTHVDVLQTAQHWMCPPPFPPAGVPCPVPCDRSPFPVCSPGDCPGTCSSSGATCRTDADCPVGDSCVGVEQCVPNDATGACRCEPGFPPAGTDLSPTVGTLRVDVIGVGPVDPSLSGQTLLQWQNPQTDPGTGQRTVQTEMLSLSLSGSHPSIGNLNVTAGAQQGLPPTLGNVVPLGAGGDFPALATFDVFFDVEVQGVATLRNDQPLVMQAEITEIPPRSIGLRNAAPVQITDIVDPQHIDTIQIAQHWMCPPPFPPPGVPCPVPCGQSPFPVCEPGSCPTPSQHCAPSPATGLCVCVGGFPPAGTDLSPTVGTLRVDVIGVGPVDVGVAGQTLLQFSGPLTDPGTGERTVQTEMLSLSLSGSHPSIGNLNVTAGAQQGLPPTLGNVVPLGPGSDFPALATFDVFFDVEVQGVATLRNDQPLVMQAEITEIPPRAVGLRNAAPVQITDIADPQHIDTIQIAQHWMCPPPFPPPGVPCPVPCDRNPFPVCSLGACPTELPLCVPDAAAQSCRCVRPFPPAGFDLSPTTGLVLVDVIGVGPTHVGVAGETLLQWQDPQTDPGTGQRTVQTEMLSLSLSGSNPSIGTLNVTAGTNHGLPPTLGSVTPLGPGADFPALATFDVFFDVEVQGVATLRNSQPLVMQAEIVEIPPRNLGLQNLGPVQITDIADPQHIDTIQTAVHWMCPPPFPPPGVPCPVPCSATPFPLCDLGACPPGLTCTPDPTGCACLAAPPPVAGEVPDRTPDVPLTLSKATGGLITLEWGASCLSTDTDYAIYDGAVSSYYSHGGLFCSTGGATSITFAPATGSRYYLVVPHQGSVEGSYGLDGAGAPRPPGSPACRPQSSGVCP